MLKDLEEVFRASGIDYAAPGFYNSPSFLAVERDNPDFLRNYGFYVQHRIYGKEYLNSVRAVIPKIAKIFFDELSAIKLRHRRCIDISNTFVKVLELHGIWAFSVEGSLRVDYPPTSGLDRSYWWHFDDLPTLEQKRKMPGHVWVLCPPFQIIDLTLKYQEYKQGEEKYVPDFVLAEEVEYFSASLNDLCSPDYRAYLKSFNVTSKEFLNRTLFSHFSNNMRPATYRYEGAAISYIPFSFTGIEEATIDEIRNITFSGLSVRQLYTKKLLPIFASHAI